MTRGDAKPFTLHQGQWVEVVGGFNGRPHTGVIDSIRVCPVSGPMVHLEWGLRWWRADQLRPVRPPKFDPNPRPVLTVFGRLPEVTVVLEPKDATP